MKKRLLSIALPVVACLGLIMTSCGGDDDGNGIPALPTPEYESSSAKYEMAAGSPYRSIEFTSSGNYVIVTNSHSYYSAAPAAKVKKQTAVGTAMASGLLRTPERSVSRAYFNGIYYGTYTKTGDNQYNLQGFGTITVNTGGDNAYSLTVTTSSGSQTIAATKAVADKDSDRTNALCRTWNVDKLNLKVWINGSKKYDRTVAANKLNDLFEDWGDDGWEDNEIPRQVIFTKSGTYMVLYGLNDYSNNSLDISSWRWENESKGIIRYSWDIGNFDDEDSGLITTSFSGKNMTIWEEYSEEDDGDNYREKITWYFSEAK